MGSVQNFDNIRAEGTIIMNWIWLTGGVVLCALEALAPGMFLLWLGVASIATGLLLTVTSLGFEWSLLAFCGFAVVSVLIGRRFYGSRDQQSDQPFLNRRADAMVGQVFTLEQAIQDGEGRIRYRDSVWRVSGPDLPVGARVKVISVPEPTVLKVEAA